MVPRWAPPANGEPRLVVPTSCRALLRGGCMLHVVVVARSEVGQSYAKSRPCRRCWKIHRCRFGRPGVDACEYGPAYNRQVAAIDGACRHHCRLWQSAITGYLFAVTEGRFAHFPVIDLNCTVVANGMHCTNALQTKSAAGRAVTWSPSCRKLKDFAPQQVCNDLA